MKIVSVDITLHVFVADNYIFFVTLKHSPIQRGGKKEKSIDPRHGNSLRCCSAENADLGGHMWHNRGSSGLSARLVIPILIVV